MMIDKENIHDLIHKIKSGDRDAFGILYRHYYPPLYGFLQATLQDSYLAEEISQEVFLRVWINREHLYEQVSLRPYLAQIAKNLATDYFRRKEVEQDFLTHLKQTIENEESTENQLEFHEIQALINGTIQSMPPQQRKVFQLSREESLQNAEIAERLHISKRTVEKHISNALTLIRKTLTRHSIYILLQLINTV